MTIHEFGTMNQKSGCDEMRKEQKKLTAALLCGLLMLWKR